MTFDGAFPIDDYWRCKYCGRLNIYGRVTCKQCGRSKESS